MLESVLLLNQFWWECIPIGLVCFFSQRMWYIRSPPFVEIIFGERILIAKRPPISWDTACPPLKAGGLGFVNLLKWNIALLAKQILHLQLGTGLWAQWMKEHYFPSSTWDNYLPLKVHSASAKHLVQVRDMVSNVNVAQSKVHAIYDQIQSPTASVPWF